MRKGGVDTKASIDKKIYPYVFVAEWLACVTTVSKVPRSNPLLAKNIYSLFCGTTHKELRLESGIDA